MCKELCKFVRLHYPSGIRWHGGSQNRDNMLQEKCTAPPSVGVTEFGKLLNDRANGDTEKEQKVNTKKTFKHTWREIL